MIANFPLLQQPPGSNSCLPSCVRAVLLWHGEQITRDEVSEWCAEDPNGCVLDLAIDGLRNAGFDVKGITARSEQEAREWLRATVTDEDEPQPVIVTLQDPYASFPMDHAVVVINIQQSATVPDVFDLVEFADPLTGRVEQDTAGMFWEQWAFAGLRAFTIRA